MSAASALFPAPSRCAGFVSCPELALGRTGAGPGTAGDGKPILNHPSPEGHQGSKGMLELAPGGSRQTDAVIRFKLELDQALQGIMTPPSG